MYSREHTYYTYHKKAAKIILYKCDGASEILLFEQPNFHLGKHAPDPLQQIMKNSSLKSKFYEKEEVRTYIQEAVLDRIDHTKYGIPYVTVGTAFNLYM